MYYRGPGFLAVVWFGSSPIPLLPSPGRQFSVFLSFPMYRRSSLLTGDGEGHRVLTPLPFLYAQRRQVEIIWTSKIPPLLLTGLGERYSQTVSNLCQAALLRRCMNSPYKWKCRTTSEVSLFQSLLLWGGGEVGEEPNHTARKPNTLWYIHTVDRYFLI